MSRLVRGPVIGEHTKAAPAPTAPDPTAPPPTAPPELVDQLVTVVGIAPGATASEPDSAVLGLGPLDPTHPAPLVAVHVVVTAAPIADALDGPTILALAGALSGSWSQSTPPEPPGSQIKAAVAGVPVGLSHWYTVLEYAA